MTTKTITVRGKQVTVTDTDLSAEEMPTKELTAVVGSTTVKRHITFGAVDGQRIVLTQSDVQISLDAARQGIAEEATWREEVKAFVGGAI